MITHTIGTWASRTQTRVSLATEGLLPNRLRLGLLENVPRGSFRWLWEALVACAGISE